jgi:hypothetical protein
MSIRDPSGTEVAPHRPMVKPEHSAGMIPLLWLLAALAITAPAGAQQYPKPVGYVNDFANVITPELEARIQRVADEVRQKSGGEIVVVTLTSLEGRTRDEVALAMRAAPATKSPSRSDASGESVRRVSPATRRATPACSSCSCRRRPRPMDRVS